MSEFSSAEEVVARCQKVMAHAWMVRAFVRHSDEAEDFPELQEIDRAIFDFSRALEVKVEDPPGYFKMLAKKLGKFRSAVEKFAGDAPRISAHTNFAQAVISLKTCAEDLAMFRNIGERLPLITGTAAVVHWSVYRRDDNGNQFTVETGLNESAARLMVAEFEAHGHKQHYWAEVSE